ncbi:MAG TPA: nitrate reductase molybdenum cofactor assembly chaperone [Gaiellaceae bacterium]|nr:nitrate reductase molybdenum cofactor assembly chaperone [Gaiellaceae bacterium]
MIARRRARPPYALLSVCLRYPDERLAAARGELAEAVAALPRSEARSALERFLVQLEGRPQLELAQDYVETFDLHRRTSLYLSYYLHGDTRKRGMALLRLRRLYGAAGVEQATGELPDYLPLVLEFCAMAPDEVGERLLREHRPSLELLRHGLAEAGSPYRHLLDALCSCLPRLTPVERERLRRLGEEGPPSEQVGLQPFAPPEAMPGLRV